MLLNQPFPAYDPSVKTVRFTFYAGLVVFFILFLFQPFGLSSLPFSERLLHATYFGLATFGVTTLNALLLPISFSSLFNEERWTTGKELLMMLWQIISVSLVNFALMHFLYGNVFSWNSIIITLGITAAVGIFPVTLIVMLKQQMLLKKYAYGAAKLEDQLSAANKEKAVGPTGDTMLHLAGDNLNEQLYIPVHNLRFITSADNYIKVHFLENGKPTASVLRSTLKKAEAGLTDYPQIFRCHRGYLVNLNAVEHISGNAQGYRLHLKDLNDTIPVSRSINNDLEELINRHSTVSRLSQ